MVHNPDHTSYNLIRVLESKANLRFFHNIEFDCKFLLWWMNIRLHMPTIRCTKTASKMWRPSAPSGLSSCIRDVLGITITKDKKVTTSNWNSTLTDEQKIYAADDVLYLQPLYFKMQTLYCTRGITDAIETIINKAYLEVQGYGDIFLYDGQPNKRLRQLWLDREQEMFNA